MKSLVVFVCFIISVCQSLAPPPAVPCPSQLCKGKPDGNYEHYHNGVYDPNYFIQCSNEIARCQACWPLRLVFSEKCNQCLHGAGDDCVTTNPWQPATTFHCPDKCPKMGVDFSGNLKDPYNPSHYIACWKGVTVGCIPCPAGLEFNQDDNACLYDGVYRTEPLRDEDDDDDFV